MFIFSAFLFLWTICLVLVINIPHDRDGSGCRHPLVGRYLCYFMLHIHGKLGKFVIECAYIRIAQQIWRSSTQWSCNRVLVCASNYWTDLFTSFLLKRTNRKVFTLVAQFNTIYIYICILNLKLNIIQNNNCCVCNWCGWCVLQRFAVQENGNNRFFSLFHCLFCLVHLCSLAENNWMCSTFPRVVDNFIFTTVMYLEYCGIIFYY